MHLNTATTLLLASAFGLTSGSPLTPRSASTSFKLVYRPAPDTTLPIPLKSLAHGTWAVTSSSSSPSHLILAPDSPTSTLIFYQYISDNEQPAVATSSTGLVITPGGSATVPSNNVLELVEGNATQGVRVGTTPLLQYAEGKFQACKDGEEIVLRYVKKGQRVLEGCMETELVVRCMGEGSGGELGENVEVECYMTPF